MMIRHVQAINGIIRGTNQSATAVLEAPRGVTSKGLAPMPLYRISDDIHVPQKSRYYPNGATPVERFWNRVDKKRDSDCWYWTGRVNGSGYGAFSYRSIGVGAHRFSWMLHNGGIPKGQLVCHRCDNRLCVNPKHLFLGTPRDNSQDAVSKGRHRFGSLPGESNPRAKLTLDQVYEIRAAFDVEPNQSKLAREYGVSRCSIQRIVNGTGWILPGDQHQERA